MDELTDAPAPRFRFSSGSFLMGFGIGSFLGVAFALIAIALVRGADSSDATAQPVIPTVEAPSGRAPTPTPTPVNTSRLRTTTELDVRLGPGIAFAVVGIMARGEAIEIVGRDATGSWVAVQFPPGSTGRGWLRADQIENLENVEELAIVLPTPLPRTSAPPPAFPGFDISGNDGTVDVTPFVVPGLVTPTPSLPVSQGGGNLATDLAIVRASMLEDGRVRVVVGNAGPGVLEDQIVVVVVRDLGSNSEQLLITQEVLAGRSVTVKTQVVSFRDGATVQVLVDPGAVTRDPDRSNNFISTVLSRTAPATPRGGASGQ